MRGREPSNHPTHPETLALGVATDVAPSDVVGDLLAGHGTICNGVWGAPSAEVRFLETWSACRERSERHRLPMAPVFRPTRGMGADIGRPIRPGVVLRVNV